jgi:hypothetical protein
MAKTEEEEDALSLDASSMSGLEDNDEDDAQAPQQPSSSGRWHFSADDADVLVRIVKLAQKHSMAGRRGSWKEYLLARFSYSVCVHPSI